MASGQIKLTISDWSGSICCPTIDDCPQNCEYDFEFCIGLMLGGKCAFSKLHFRTPHQIPQKYGLRIGSMTPMILTANVDNLQPGWEMMHIEASVADTSTKVVFVEKLLDLKANSKFHYDLPAETYRLSFDLEFNCDPGFYGDECEKYCKPPEKDDHHVCTDHGKQCLDGWTGSDCDEPICQQKCVHGQCVAPNQCACLNGWFGDSCDKCQTSEGCVHGFCADKPNTCICHDNWGGKNCDKMADKCRDRPCLNGGNCTSESLFDHYSCSCPPGFSGKNCEISIVTVIRSEQQAPQNLAVNSNGIVDNPLFWIFAIVLVIVAGIVGAIWLNSRRKTGIASQLRAGRRSEEMERDSLGSDRRKKSTDSDSSLIQQLTPTGLSDMLRYSVPPPTYNEAMEKPSRPSSPEMERDLLQKI